MINKQTTFHSLKYIFFIILILFLFNYYSKGINYTKEMTVEQTNNQTIILKDSLTNRIYQIPNTNKQKYSKYLITFNDNNTEWISDDIIINVKGIQ